ncbi:restriction endonuclease subunit S [Diaminobutyricibacter sp. McL0618]|uniref:restriction endonuclease subunit S n=1 Tax=Leifsonia sp. McL0618 TaxID=3415677 RepID=UPI003CEE3DFE
MTTRITYGFTNPMPTTTAGPAMVTARDIRGGRIDYASARRTDADAYRERLTDKSRPRVGDVLLTKDGSIGRVAVCDRPDVCINQSVALLQVTEEVHSPFLSYLLQSPKYQDLLEQGAQGSTIKHIYISRVGDLPINLPPLSEQRAIAEVLRALDDKSAANIALAATADQFLAATFQDALDRENTSAGMLDEFDVQFGEPFSGDQFCSPGSGRPLIRIRDLKTFESQIWTTEQRVRETVIYPGDVLVGMDAEFRATAWEGRPGLLNQRVCKFSHKSFGNALIREAIKRPLAEVEAEKSATTVIHLNKSDLARKFVAIPTGNAALQFETVAEPLYATRIALAQENRTLAATRDTLLPQLMSGKLRVRDAEAAASAAGA